MVSEDKMLVIFKTGTVVGVGKVGKLATGTG